MSQFPKPIRTSYDRLCVCYLESVFDSAVFLGETRRRLWPKPTSKSALRNVGIPLNRAARRPLKNEKTKRRLLAKIRDSNILECDLHMFKPRVGPSMRLVRYRWETIRARRHPRRTHYVYETFDRVFADSRRVEVLVIHFLFHS